jgi:predicted methyltransferase
MSEALLGQPINITFKFLDESIRLHNAGRSWEALRLLRDSVIMLYHDPKDITEIEALKTVTNIIEDEAAEILQKSRASKEATQYQYDAYLNRRAREVFLDQGEAYQQYLQRNSYYMLTNKSWGTITPTATMKVQQQPPQTKKYSEKLSGELI